MGHRETPGRALDLENPFRTQCEWTNCERAADEFKGLLCRMHWRCVPKVIQEQYRWSKKMVLKAVQAYEEVP